MPFAVAAAPGVAVGAVARAAVRTAVARAEVEFIHLSYLLSARCVALLAAADVPLLPRIVGSAATAVSVRVRMIVKKPVNHGLLRAGHHAVLEPWSQPERMKTSDTNENRAASHMHAD